MAITSIEGFEQYNPSSTIVTLPGGGTGPECYADLLSRANGFLQWTGSATPSQVSMPTGRFGYGQCLAVAGNNSFYPGLTASIAGNPTALTLGFAFILSDSSDLWLRFCNSQTIEGGVCGWPQFSIRFIPTSGAIVVYEGGGGTGPQPNNYPNPTTVITSTGSNAFQPGVWQFFETKFDMAAGAIGIRNNNTLLANVASGAVLNVPAESGRPTIGAFFDTLAWTGAYLTAYVSMQLDDMYTADTNTTPGLYPANSYVGDCRVQVKLPSSAGSSTTWTPGSVGGTTGSNWQQVSHGYSLGDLEYNTTTTPGAADSFAMSALETNASSVIALQTVLSARKTDAGVREIGGQIISGSETATTGTAALSSNYVYYFGVQGTDPNTSSTWSLAAVNACQGGYLAIE